MNGAEKQLGREDLKTMTAEEIVEAKEAGRFDHLLNTHPGVHHAADQSI